VEGILCDEGFFLMNRNLNLANLNKSENYLQKIRAYHQTKWFINQTASWNSRYQAKFTDILTRVGYGFAFNMIPNSEMFTDKQVLLAFPIEFFQFFSVSQSCKGLFVHGNFRPEVSR
jgi:hypothetical protein